MARKKDDDNQDNQLDNEASARLLREVDEELRREQYEKMWRRYGGMLIMACVAIVIGTALGVYWNHHTRQTNMVQTDQLYSWLAQEDKAQRLQDTTTDITSPQTAQDWLTLFYAGNDALELQDYDRAQEIYKVLREKRELGGEYRWLADLMELRTLMQVQKENAQLAETRQRLEDLAAQEANPWRALAYFEAAVIAGHTQGAYDEALELLNSASRHSAGSTPLMSMIRDMRHLFTVQKTLEGAEMAENKPEDIAPATNE